MPHISLPDLPGIRGPMAFRPETARPLNELVDVLLRGPHSLTPGERELIATFVSAQNDCRYCQTIHGAIAAHHLGGAEDLDEGVRDLIRVEQEKQAQVAVWQHNDLVPQCLLAGGRREDGTRRFPGLAGIRCP